MTVPLRPGRLALSLLILAGACLARPAHAQSPAAPGDAEGAPQRGCATYLEVMSLLDARSRSTRDTDGQAGTAASLASAASTARATKANAGSLPGRTLLTPHFALHYTLAPNVNRPRWVTEDAGDPPLKSLVDSLLATLSSLSAPERDSVLHAKLDSMNAPHPRYVTRSGEHFERAWAHYDSLGMRMPDSSASLYFKTPTHGRVAIDIADIGTVDPSRVGPYYGLAYPPDGNQKASILLENDFRYNAVYNNAAGQATGGSAIRALYKGEILRDYSIEWDMGLKVTASHEFYHIVQYEYTPSLTGYHAWYELSATGMEERLAPEVNDYFQYLPFNVQRTHDTPLTTAGTLANYGNAIFHVFLTKMRGPDFDRVIWEHLGNNSLTPRNHLGNALVAMAGSQSAWDSLFTAYAAALSIAGTPGSTNSPLAFSPDMPQWPVPHFDSVTTAGTQINMPAATFRLVRAPATGAALATLVGFTHSQRVDSSAAGYQSYALESPVVSIAKGTGVTRSTSAFANSAFSGTRPILLARPEATALATRNPIARGAGPLFILAPTGGAQDTMQVVSESGRRVAAVPADSSGAFWSWDLKDQAARTVPAGLYFFRRAGEPPQSVLIVP